MYWVEVAFTRPSKPLLEMLSSAYEVRLKSSNGMAILLGPFSTREEAERVAGEVCGKRCVLGVNVVPGGVLE
ncbi:MAG: hypothetical protein DRJ41_00635 [Thermoprotei archaeon]|nr:MAG: hypothetical protein DRJ41_00635 [Thermoprotei archaeon]